MLSASLLLVATYIALPRTQADFKLEWFDVPEYDVGLRQPESFGVCAVRRRPPVA